MDIESLSAHIEIRQRLVEYCRGVDRGDASLIAGAYHEDAVDRHGAYVGGAEEFARIVVAKFDAAGLTAQHHLTNTYIELDGDRARVESYFIAYRPQRNANNEPELVPLSGRYLDRFEKRNGQWKIAERDVVFDWLRQPIALEELDTTHGYPPGGRRGDDLSSTLFPMLRGDSA